MTPKELGPNCGRVIWQAIRSREMPCSHNTEPTVAFRTSYEVHYKMIEAKPPVGFKADEETIIASANWWRALSKEERKSWTDFFTTGQW